MGMIVSTDEWLVARKQLLSKEKELTRLRDELTRERQRLPWRRVDTDYVFADQSGPVSLAGLFDGRSQLLVYHFMLGPDWEEGCPSCSFWADSFNGTDVHLRQRDVAFACVSRAAVATIAAYQRRMGWQFRWVSSEASTFNIDFGVVFTPEQQAGAIYNYGPVEQPGDERPGLSAFALDETGTVYHTYSCYARGLDAINGAYQLLDLAPKGRDEDGLPNSMAWVRRHDSYDG